MREQWPLATIHDTVLDFLRGREDAVLYGAQAVNAYVDEARMTQDVDVLSTRAPELAEEIRAHLNEQFQIAVRVRKVREGIGYRVYELHKPKNRHLVDVRAVDRLPAAQRVDDVLVLTPAELIAAKVLAWRLRQGKPKSGTDWRDLAELLLAFPDLKTDDGPVARSLRSSGAPESILAAWHDIVSQEILPEDDDAGY